MLKEHCAFPIDSRINAQIPKHKFSSTPRIRCPSFRLGIHLEGVGGTDSVRQLSGKRSRDCLEVVHLAAIMDRHLAALAVPAYVAKTLPHLPCFSDLVRLL